MSITKFLTRIYREKRRNTVATIYHMREKFLPNLAVCNVIPKYSESMQLIKERRDR
jgi:hypothetical protein